MISEAIYEVCRGRNKSLNIAWFDYQKTFDSVPHG
jgi:hypothetical protein